MDPPETKIMKVQSIKERSAELYSAAAENAGSDPIESIESIKNDLLKLAEIPSSQISSRVEGPVLEVAFKKVKIFASF